MKENEDWDTVITPRRSLFSIDWKEIFRYRDLLFLFVRRDFVAIYKQTILGPLWFVIQPILTTITFTIVFGRFAKLSTDEVPQVVFYMAGITVWGYFADCLRKTSSTFVANKQIFGKVYFPRVIQPVSIVVTSLLKFGVQLILFLGVFLYFFFTQEGLEPNAALLMLPVLIILMGGLGLGMGMIISAMTTKYRDLTFLVGFGISLLMYASPIVYPLSIVPEKYEWLIMLNPMSSVIETFKHAFFGTGELMWPWLIYSLTFTAVVLAVGLFTFNRVEKNFMDTV